MSSAQLPPDDAPASLLPNAPRRVALHGRRQDLGDALTGLGYALIPLTLADQARWPDVLEALSDDTRPELILCVLDGEAATRRTAGIERLEVPTVGLWATGEPEAGGVEAALRFDYVACATPEQAAILRAGGCRNVFVLPDAAGLGGMVAWLLATPSRGLWLLAGTQHFLDGRLPEAVSAFSQALTLCPTSAEALNNLGVCMTALEQPAEARELFLAALKLDAGLASARENLIAVGGPEPAPDPLGDVSSYYMGDRPELRRLVPADTRRVLEVGCAAGGFGAALKRERPDLEVVGVEYNRKAALHAARRLDVVLQGSIDDMPDFPYPHGYFDCFVFGDVLEHLSDPEQTLQNLLPYLKEGGHIVLSLPNVRHYEVVWDLLVNGKWTYLDAGILDRTHLRFFTYQEIEAMIARLGLRLETVDVNKWVSYPDCYHALTQVVQALGGDAAAFEQEGAVGQYLMRIQKPVAHARGDRTEAHTTVPQAGAPDAPPVASIVMLTLNQLDYTKLCVESVLDRSTLPFELIIVDNGSTDGTRAFLRRIEALDARVRVIHNERNMGFAYGCNQGLAVAKGEVIVLLNNDTIVTDGWLEGLITPMATNPEIGAVGPRSNRVAGVQVVPFVPYGSDLGKLHDFARGFAEFHRGLGGFVDRAVGFCLAVRRSVLEHIGGLDTRFGIGNFEDDDLCLRVQTAGFRVWIASDVFIHHFGSQTFIGEKIDYRALMGENSQKFAEKWQASDAPDQAYDAGRLARLPFDRARDIFPVLVPNAEGAPISGAKGHHFLALPDWRRPESCLDAIKAFNAAFTADDDVALLLWVNPAGEKSVEAVSAELGALLAAHGLDGAQTPDLVIFDTAFSAMTMSSLYRTAQTCLPLGDAAVAEAAAACGLQVIDHLSAEALRAAAAQPDERPRGPEPSAPPAIAGALDPRRVAFITCVNDEALYAQCQAHLRALEVPAGFSVELIALRQAESMTSAYEAAMRDSDAKYKVYLHQDAFIRHPHFIADMVRLFERHPRVGMFGVAGAARLPASAVWWEGKPKYGQVIEYQDGEKVLAFEPVNGDYQSVEAIDGVLMATQYDVAWNTLLDGFHFYDTAHSLDFRSAGYEVAVPAQDVPWVMHYHDDVFNKQDYVAHRARFLQLYP